MQLHEANVKSLTAGQPGQQQHHHLLEALNQLALAYSGSGQHGQALATHQQVLRLREEEQLQATHVDVMASLCNIGKHGPGSQPRRQALLTPTLRAATAGLRSFVG